MEADSIMAKTRENIELHPTHGRALSASLRWLGKARHSIGLQKKDGG
jgi:hypothetical protein